MVHNYVVKCVLIACLLISSFNKPLLGQSFFTPGYIITATGDTSKGEVAQKENRRILFRTTKENQQSYEAAQLKAFVVEGIRSVVINWKDRDSVHHAFAKELLQGTVSLYGLTKPEGELTYFLQLPNKTFIPLEGKASWNALNAYLNECQKPSFMTRLDASRYRYVYPYFADIVRAYNECISPGQTVSQKRNSFHFQVGILVGAAANQFKYGAVEDRFKPYYQPNGLYPTYISYTLGAYGMVMPQKRFSVMIEGYYGRYEGERAVDLNNPSDPTIKRQRLYSFWRSFWAFPLSARFVFADGAIRWYAKAGVSYVKDISNGGFMESLDPGISLEGDLFIRKGSSVGYLVGIGAEFKLGKKQRLNAEIRTVPHIVRDGGATRIGDLRSYQFVLSAPVFQR